MATSLLSCRVLFLDILLHPKRSSPLVSHFPSLYFLRGSTALDSCFLLHCPVPFFFLLLLLRSFLSACFHTHIKAAAAAAARANITQACGAARAHAMLNLWGGKEEEEEAKQEEEEHNSSASYIWHVIFIFTRAYRAAVASAAAKAAQFEAFVGDGRRAAFVQSAHAVAGRTGSKTRRGGVKKK